MIVQKYSNLIVGHCRSYPYHARRAYHGLIGISSKCANQRILHRNNKNDCVLNLTKLNARFISDKDKDKLVPFLAGAFHSNPLNQYKAAFNKFKIKAYYDKSFDEDEFLDGVKLVVSRIASILSSQEHKHLCDIMDEKFSHVLRNKTAVMDEEQKLALELKKSDIIISKVKAVHIVDTKDDKLISIDTACLAIKPGEKGGLPFMIGIGLRFHKDMIADPTSWKISGVNDCFVERAPEFSI